jgi:hypothetical protein
MMSSLDYDIASSVATTNARHRLRDSEAGLLIETDLEGSEPGIASRSAGG